MAGPQNYPQYPVEDIWYQFDFTNPLTQGGVLDSLVGASFTVPAQILLLSAPVPRQNVIEQLIGLSAALAPPATNLTGVATPGAGPGGTGNTGSDSTFTAGQTVKVGFVVRTPYGVTAVSPLSAIGITANGNHVTTNPVTLTAPGTAVDWYASDSNNSNTVRYVTTNAGASINILGFPPMAAAQAPTVNTTGYLATPASAPTLAQTTGTGYPNGDVVKVAFTLVNTFGIETAASPLGSLTLSGAGNILTGSLLPLPVGALAVRFYASPSNGSTAVVLATATDGRPATLAGYPASAVVGTAYLVTCKAFTATGQEFMLNATITPTDPNQ